MGNFMLTALTPKGLWYEFTILDVACMVDDTKFALLKKPNSPLMYVDLIRRGFDGFYEGDIWKDEEGCEWLICYERGFYAIDRDYRIVYLDKCKEWRKVSSCMWEDFPIKCSFRTKHLFKTDDTIYRMDYIYGIHGDGVLVRGFKNILSPTNIHQECCITYNNSRVFLGDSFEEGDIDIRNGRIVLSTHADGIYKDIVTGGLVC